jgi:hypothetical protein
MAIQRKPVAVQTKHVRTLTPDIPAFGMFVENIVIGDEEGLEGYLVSERIERVGFDNPPYVPTGMRTSETEFTPARPAGDDTRIDAHTLAAEELNKVQLMLLDLSRADPSRHYCYTVNQLFVYKAAGEAKTMVIPNSGFQIQHHVFKDAQGLWLHIATKTPKNVTVNGVAAQAGRGGTALSEIRGVFAEAKAAALPAARTGPKVEEVD